MSSDRIFDQKSANRRAFDHYLRTGQRLTATEWIERKFNPYHDKIGRFTSASGVTVSWGVSQPAQATHLSKRRVRSSAPQLPSSPGKIPKIASQGRGRSSPTHSRLLDGLTSERVSNAAKPGGPAETHFELLKRQIDLDAFRAALLHPNDKEKADLAEVQRRYDFDRSVLAYRDNIADQQVLEIGRAGMAPVDVIAGGIKITRGEGALRDYFAVGGVVPVTSGIRYLRGVPQIGGSQSLVTSIIKDLKLVGFDKHHNWAKKSMEIAGLRLPSDMIPLTGLLRADHMKTGSWGSSFDAARYRMHQAKFLERGELSEAAIMDAKNIDDVTNGAYSHASEEFLRFVREVENKIERKFL